MTDHTHLKFDCCVTCSMFSCDCSDDEHDQVNKSRRECKACIEELKNRTLADYSTSFKLSKEDLNETNNSEHLEIRRKG